MQYIRNHLISNDYPNTSKLARELEVSRKTVQRDIEYMRDQLGEPIDYDASLHGYYYTEHVESFPSVQISESELFALLVAEKAIDQYRGTPYEGPLSSALNKFSGALRASGNVALYDLDSAVLFKPLGVSDINVELFQVLSRAVVCAEEVKFRYKKVKGSKYEERHVQPYYMMCIDNLWYLFTYDLKRKASRLFALTRIKDIELIGKHFKKDPNVCTDKEARAGFGAFLGEATIEVVIEFDRVASGFVKERKWHPDQQIKDLSNGKIVFTVKVVSMTEIESWVLRWGAHAVVKKPVKLRNRMKKTAELMLAEYG